jgi:hypothetical protein
MVKLTKVNQTLMGHNASGKLICAVTFIAGNLPPNFAAYHGHEFKSMKQLKAWAQPNGLSVYMY